MISAQALAIRHAIECGEYDHATRLWNQWSAELRSASERGEPRKAEWAEAMELYEWSRTTLRCARSHLTDRLNALHVAGAYGVPASRGTAAVNTKL